MLDSVLSVRLTPMSQSDYRNILIRRSAVALTALGFALLLSQLLLHGVLDDSSRTSRLLALANHQSDLCARLRPEGHWSPAREQSYLELQRSRDEWTEVAQQPSWALRDWILDLRSWRRGGPSARALDSWKACSAELARRQTQLSAEAGLQLQSVQEMQRGWTQSVLLVLALQAFFLIRPGRPQPESRRDGFPNTQTRLLANLEAAARVQRSLLPTQAPSVPGLNFAWQYHPCEKVAGDMYGIQVLNERYVACYVLDVSGHGMPAALLSVSLSRTLSDVEGLLRRHSEVTLPSQVVSELNRRFPVMSQSDQFITLLYGVLDLEQRTLTYVRAGHPGPMVSRARGVWMQDDQEGCPPVGILEEVEYRDEVLALEPGDRVLLYTDGITEAADAGGDMFGTDRLVHALEESRGRDLQTALHGLMERVERFSSTARLRDDLTMLGFELAVSAAEPARSPRSATRMAAAPRDLAWCARNA